MNHTREQASLVRESLIECALRNVGPAGDYFDADRPITLAKKPLRRYVQDFVPDERSRLARRATAAGPRRRHGWESIAAVRLDLEGSYPTLHMVGRNGMHKYNNQDHAMMTAMLTAQNILAGERRYDVWNVNEDAEYHEAGESGVQSALDSVRLVPEKVADTRAA